MCSGKGFARSSSPRSVRPVLASPRRRLELLRPSRLRSPRRPPPSLFLSNRGLQNKRRRTRSTSTSRDRTSWATSKIFLVDSTWRTMCGTKSADANSRVLSSELPRIRPRLAIIHIQELRGGDTHIMPLHRRQLASTSPRSRTQERVLTLTRSGSGSRPGLCSLDEGRLYSPLTPFPREILA